MYMYDGKCRLLLNFHTCIDPYYEVHTCNLLNLYSMKQKCVYFVVQGTMLLVCCGSEEQLCNAACHCLVQIDSSAGLYSTFNWYTVCVVIYSVHTRTCTCTYMYMYMCVSIDWDNPWIVVHKLQVPRKCVKHRL